MYLLQIMKYHARTYYNKKDLPDLEDKNFFHFTSSFDWYGDISYYKPLMIVVFIDEKPVASISALIMRINRFLYGSAFKRCYISQKPSFYINNLNEIEVFDILISTLVKEVGRRVLYIEYRNINSPTFGYKGFRDNGFYYAKWISVFNSLQKKRDIWNQLSSTRKNQVNKAIRKGVVMEQVTTKEELRDIYTLINKSRNWKVFNRFPPYQYFENFLEHYVSNNKGRIVVAKYKDRIIGGAILGFQKKKVCVLYFWGKDKSHKFLNPTVYTLFSSMEMAEKEGYEVFDFMDSGYLNIRAGKPRFLLQFGGKSKATRRWYRFNWRFMNFFAKRIYD